MNHSRNHIDVVTKHPMVAFKGRTHGFTLIEIIVVMLIMGIIVLASVPYFGSFANRTKLESSCRDWMAYANYARSQAVLNGSNYRMNCDLDQQTFWLTYQASTSELAGQYVPVDGMWGKTVSIDSSVQLVSIQFDQNSPQDSGLLTIDFSPRGTAVDALITFQTYAEQDQKVVSLNRVTGLARIYSDETTES